MTLANYHGLTANLMLALPRLLVSTMLVFLPKRNTGRHLWVNDYKASAEVGLKVFNTIV